MLQMLFSGSGAALISGLLGFFGSVALAVPAISSVDSRRTLLQLQRLQLELKVPSAFDQQAKPLLKRALREIATERRWYRTGFALLGLSFALTVAKALFEGS